MLDVKDYAQIGNVSTILVGIIDRCFAQGNYSPITDVFITYVNLVNNIFRKNKWPDWTPMKMRDLSTLINKLKNDNRYVSKSSGLRAENYKIPHAKLSYFWLTTAF